jgi:hypothetical protein
MEPVSISVIIVSILTAIGVLIAKIKCKHLKLCCCIESDCARTPHPTPRNSTSSVYTASDIHVNRNATDL